MYWEWSVSKMGVWTIGFLTLALAAASRVAVPRPEMIPEFSYLPWGRNEKKTWNAGLGR
jgi:hypothetical protein